MVADGRQQLPVYPGQRSRLLEQVAQMRQLGLGLGDKGDRIYRLQPLVVSVKAIQQATQRAILLDEREELLRFRKQRLVTIRRECPSQFGWRGYVKCCIQLGVIIVRQRQLLLVGDSAFQLACGYLGQKTGDGLLMARLPVQCGQLLLCFA